MDNTNESESSSPFPKHEFRDFVESIFKFHPINIYKLTYSKSLVNLYAENHKDLEVAGSSAHPRHLQNSSKEMKIPTEKKLVISIDYSGWGKILRRKIKQWDLLGLCFCLRALIFFFSTSIWVMTLGIVNWLKGHTDFCCIKNNVDCWVILG